MDKSPKPKSRRFGLLEMPFKEAHRGMSLVDRLILIRHTAEMRKVRRARERAQTKPKHTIQAYEACVEVLRRDYSDLDPMPNKCDVRGEMMDGFDFEDHRRSVTWREFDDACVEAGIVWKRGPRRSPRRKPKRKT